MPILYVLHDEEERWQFLNGKTHETDNAVVTLKDMPSGYSAEKIFKLMIVAIMGGFILKAIQEKNK